MANPYRTPHPRDSHARSPQGRLLTASVAFGCVCVVAGCALARSDSRLAILSAFLGGALITRRESIPR